MSRFKNFFIMIIISLAAGVMLAGFDGRVSEKYFCIESVSMTLFTLSYFFGSEISLNIIENILTSVAAVGLPCFIWTVLVDKMQYFTFEKKEFIIGSFMIGGIICIFALLTRKEQNFSTAFGRNMLPAFFGVCAGSKIAAYMHQTEKFSIDFTNGLFFCGFLYTIFSLGTFIGANRQKLKLLESWVTTAVWVGFFIALRSFLYNKDLIPWM